MELLEKKELVKKAIGTSGKLFNVTFVKKNGKVRKFNARTGVYSYTTGSGKGLSYNPDALGYLKCFSIDDLGYRMVNFSTISRIKANGVELNFDTK
jgi:hypothetical protein